MFNLLMFQIGMKHWISDEDFSKQKDRYDDDDVATDPWKI